MRSVRLAAIVIVFGVGATIQTACASKDERPRGAPASHRASATACSEERPPGLNVDAGELSCTSFNCCSNDQQCADAGANGRCTQTFGPYDGLQAVCTADQCFSDGDCPAQRVCDCRGSLLNTDTSASHRCLPLGNCRVDSDCGPGGYCSPSLDVNCGSGMGVRGYFCHTPNDDCIDDNECQKSATTGEGYCAFDPLAKRWVCSSRVCRD